MTMKADEKRAIAATEFCGYCGHKVPADQPPTERFGQRFCSERHADDFTAGVRKARIAEAAATPGAGTACSMPPPGQRTWKDYLKRSACWGAPLLLLLAIPLLWSGSSVAATGGSLLSVVALLACPLGMYFMMRSMGSMNHQAGRPDEPQRPAEPIPSWKAKGEQ